MQTIQPSLDLTPYCNDAGKVLPRSWPGMYPLYFITQDCCALCPACVNDNRKLINAAFADEDQQWNVVAANVNYEDDSLYCEHCNKQIESAYGNDEDGND